MADTTFEEIVGEKTAFLLPHERKQLREVLNQETQANGFWWFLLAAGLVLLLEKRNVLTPDERRRLHDSLNRAAVDSGLVRREDLVRSVRGKYAHLHISSEEFA